MLSVTQGHKLRGASSLLSCSVVTILKFLIILNKGALRFHFALGLQIIIICPNLALSVTFVHQTQIKPNNCSYLFGANKQWDLKNWLCTAVWTHSVLFMQNEFIPSQEPL